MSVSARKKRGVRPQTGHVLRQRAEAGNAEAIAELQRRKGNRKGSIDCYWEMPS